MEWFRIITFATLSWYIDSKHRGLPVPDRCSLNLFFSTKLYFPLAHLYLTVVSMYRYLRCTWSNKIFVLYSYSTASERERCTCILHVVVNTWKCVNYRLHVTLSFILLAILCNLNIFDTIKQTTRPGLLIKLVPPIHTLKIPMLYVTHTPIDHSSKRQSGPVITQGACAGTCRSGHCFSRTELDGFVTIH